MRRLPKGFRRGHDDSVACPHRDLSCCAACVAQHEELVDVAGVVFFYPDHAERAELQAELTARAARWAAEDARDGVTP